MNPNQLIELVLTDNIENDWKLQNNQARNVIEYIIGKRMDLPGHLANII